MDRFYFLSNIVIFSTFLGLVYIVMYEICEMIQTDYDIIPMVT